MEWHRADASRNNGQPFQTTFLLNYTIDMVDACCGGQKGYQNGDVVWLMDG